MSKNCASNYSAKAFVNLDMQNNTWQSGSTYTNRYYNAFSYDANGNILTQTRYAENGTQIEDMTYQYNRNTNGKMLQNRLYHVNDNVAANAFTDDIDDQGAFSSNNVNTANNYGYDGEGRLVRDDAEEIAQITWTVTGKVKEVIRTSGSTKKNLKFRYDAMGQRIAKEVYDANNNWEKTTYYVRDPQGNVMGIYEKKNDAQTQLLSYKIVERNIYGSSMVGLVKSDIELINAGTPNGTNFIHAIGEKQYYEQNHLSNVISVVSDLKIAHDWNGDLVVDYYRAEIISVSDVFPYGSPMQSRTMNSTAVRHSFNGQEKDDEIYGEGNMTTAEFWQYDTRLAHRWNIDPIIVPWESGYIVFSDSPIKLNDVLGNSDKSPEDIIGSREGKRKIKKFEKKEHKLAEKTGLEGEELRNEMYRRYGHKKWAHFDVGPTSQPGKTGFYLVGDLLDQKNGVQVETGALPLEPDPPINIVSGPVPAMPVITLNPTETATITVTQTQPQPAANNVAIQQNGTTVAVNNINAGNQVVANVDATKGTTITIVLTPAPVNVININNPTGITTPGSPSWTAYGFTITVQRAAPQTMTKIAKQISPWNQTYRQYMQETYGSK